MKAIIFCTSGSSANSAATHSILRRILPRREIVGDRPAAAEQFGARGAAPAQADDIETIECGDLSFGNAERNDISPQRRYAADHDALADADELMHRRIAAEKGIVADRDVAAEHCIVGECHVVADLRNRARHGSRP